MIKRLELIWQEGEYSYNNCEDSLMVELEEYAFCDGWAEEIMEELKKLGFFKINKEIKKSKLRFVGIIEKERSTDDCIIDLVIYCCPKYFDKDLINDIEKTKKEMGLVVRVIERSNHFRDFDEGRWEVSNFNNDELRIRFDDLEKWIVQDYVNNGLYYRNVSESGKHSNGRIAWGQTLRKIKPFVDKKNVYYLDFIKVRKYQDYDNWISDVHRAVLSRCLRNQHNVNECMEICADCELDVDDSEDLSLYADRIAAYQRNVFANRDIELFRALETYCRKEGRYYRAPRGTVSFQLVWEEVTREVFGNVEKFRFPAPDYYFVQSKDDGKEPVRMTHKKGDKDDALESEADLIYVGKDFFLLMDAKYYVGYGDDSDKNGTIVHGLPGYQDVGKQIDYMNTLQSRYGMDKTKGSNLFLFPRFHQEDNDRFKLDIFNGDEWIQSFGYVVKPKVESNVSDVLGDDNWDPLEKVLEQQAFSKGLTTSIDNDRVYLFQIDPHYLFEEFCYSSGNKSNYATIIIEQIEVIKKYKK